MAARPPRNGSPRKLVCVKHPDVAVTVYGLSDATAWCVCGKQMSEVSKKGSS